MTVIIGCMLGAVARFVLYERLKTYGPFFIPTILVNSIGSFALGMYLSLQTSFQYDLIVYGFLASFTTFSTFSVDCVKLLLAHKWQSCLLVIALNCIISCVAFYIGFQL